ANIVTPFWSFGDGTTNTGSQNISHWFTIAPLLNDYTVTLSDLGNPNFCPVTTTVHFDPNPQGVDFNINGIQCDGITANLEILNFNSAYSYNWFYGGSLIPATAAASTLTFPSPGTYTLELRVINGNSCPVSVVKTIVVGASNDYEIIATDNGCGVFNFHYVKLNAAAPDITSPHWNFGDGYFLAANHAPPHTYNGNGYYTVTLKDLDHPELCPIVKIIQVTGLPSTDFQIITHCNQEVQFIISGYVPPPTYSYVWDFNGTYQTATDAATIFDFPSPGSKVVKLTIFDNNGCKSTTSKIVQVGSVSAYFYAATPVCKGSNLVVQNLTSGGATYTWEAQLPGQSFWTPIGVGMNPIFPLNLAGDYAIRLTVTDIWGCPTTFHQQIVKVYEKPSVSFSETVSCTGLLSLSPSLSGITSGYAIDYGDGTTGTGGALPASFSHTYAAAGVYMVKLVVTSPGGCTGEFQKNIVVNSLASLGISASSGYLCHDGGQVLLQAVLSNATSGVSYNFSWSGTGGFTSTASQVSVQAGGTYSVSVTASGGCTQTLTASTIVTELPEPTAAVAFVQGVTCFGNDDGLATLTFSPALAAAGYSVNGGGVQNGLSLTLGNLSAGNNYVQIANAQLPGCFSMLTLPVSDDSPVLSLASQPGDCSGATGSASVSVTNGSPSYRYRWWNVLSPGVILKDETSGTSSNTLSNIFPGKYVAEVTDGSGCTVLQEIEVKKIALNPALQNTPAATCSNGEATVTVLSPYSPAVSLTPVLTHVWYKNVSGSWSPQAGSDGNTRQFPTGFYKVVVQDATTNCSAELEFNILELADLDVDLDIRQPNCANGSGKVEAVVGGGSGNYSFD
ncbi:MAG: PKD domain-containing protein, partial [Bacteroidota bacterium]